MTSLRPSQLALPAISNQPTWQYRGTNANGKIQLTYGSAKYLGIGFIGVRTPINRRLGTAAAPYRSDWVTPGYQPSISDALLLAGVCDGKEIFLFAGQIIPHPSNADKKLPPCELPLANDRPEMKPGESFELELIRVRGLRDAGLDPDVKMKFIVDYVNESQPTLYRKMAIGTFPLPTKRGKSSFWPLSQIDSYRASSGPTMPVVPLRD